MARRPLPTTLVARVRAHFGFSQAELALYLGVSPALAQHLESGRRALSAEVRPALLPLLPFVPATPDAPDASDALAPAAALPPGTTAPEAGTLAFRRRQCLHQAARLRTQAQALARQAQVARHWAAALPALLAATALEAQAATAAADAPATARATWRQAWLLRRARPLPPEAATRYHLLRARVAALLAEAAALAEVP